MFVFFVTSNASYAFTELYYVKNASKSVMENTIKTHFVENNYTLKKLSPFYAVQKKDTSKYAVAVMQQSGLNMFYYYTSNNNDKKVHKAFLKNLASQGITYEQSKNHEMAISSMSKIRVEPPGMPGCENLP